MRCQRLRTNRDVVAFVCRNVIIMTAFAVFAMMPAIFHYTRMFAHG